MRKKLKAEFALVAVEEFRSWYEEHPTSHAPSGEEILDVCTTMGIHGYVRGLRESASIVRTYSSDNLVETECSKISDIILGIERQLTRKSQQ